MDVWCSGAPQNTFINRQWRRSNFNKGYCTNKIASLCKICTHHQQHFCVMSAHIQAKACVDIVRIQFKVKCVCVLFRPLAATEWKQLNKLRDGWVSRFITIKMNFSKASEIKLLVVDFPDKRSTLENVFGSKMHSIFHFLPTATHFPLL